MLKIDKGKLDKSLENFRKHHRLVYGKTDSIQSSLYRRWFRSLKNRVHSTRRLFGLKLWDITYYEYYRDNYVHVGAHRNMYDRGDLSKEDFLVLESFWSGEFSDYVKIYNTMSKFKLDDDSSFTVDNLDVVDFFLTFLNEDLTNWVVDLDRRIREVEK